MLATIGALWLVVLLLLPIYIEPGNGSIGCGRPWRATPVETFLRSDCEHAVRNRRMALIPPGVLAGVGGILLVIAPRKSRSDDPEGSPTSCGRRLQSR